MRHIAVVTLIAGLGLAGCGGPLTEALSDCTGKGVCKVEVEVTDCVAKPNPDSLLVTGKNINIHWELDFWSGIFYRFRDNDGVKLKTPSSEFEPRPTGNNKKFMLHDKNSLTGEHKYPYTFNVQKPQLNGWVDCPPMDPTIVNQG